MKGVLMKVGQMVSFIAEGLPEEAQQALAALQADAAPMAPSLAATVIGSELGAATRAGVRVVGRHAGGGGEHRPGPPGPRRSGRELAVKVQFPGVSEAIEEDLDAAEVMYTVFSALALNGLDARALVDELRAADARGARLPTGSREHRRVRRALRRSPVGAHPDAGPGVLDIEGAHDGVDRRVVVGPVRRPRHRRRRSNGRPR